MNVNSHSGRSRSRPAMPVLRANSRTVASVLGGAASNRRTCHDKSKSGSTTQRGVASRSGGNTTRCRNPGDSRVLRSSRSVNRSQSGLPSRSRTHTTVDRSSGSFSMYQENASLSRMCTSTCSGNATTSTLFLDSVRARSGRQTPADESATRSPQGRSPTRLTLPQLVGLNDAIARPPSRTGTCVAGRRRCATSGPVELQVWVANG